MPATLATCEVYGTIFDVFGAPVEGAVVGCMAVYKNGALVLARTLEVRTDVDGYFTIDLPRGPNSVAILYANTPGLNISAIGTPTAIPDADAAELAAIIGDFDLWNEVPVAIPIGAGVSSFNGRTGAVVLTSLDVTTALGYTPADSAALAGYLLLAGGVMTGPLTLSGAPTVPLHAATKQYVDSAIGAIPPSGVSSVNGRTGAVVLTSADVSTALGYTPVNKAGDTMTGFLVLNADPTAPLGAATRQYVDSHSYTLNLNAPYPWTGSHSWTNVMLLKFGGVFIGEYSTGNPFGIFFVDSATDAVIMGPAIDRNYGTAGAKLEWLCGSGRYIDGGAGSVGVNYTPATWDFIAHAKIRGSLTLSNTFGSSNALTSGVSIVLGQSVGVWGTNSSAATQRMLWLEPSASTTMLERSNYLVISGPSGSGMYSAGSIMLSNYQCDFWLNCSMANGSTFTLYADPTAALHAATKQYVDARITAHTHAVFTTTAAGFAPASVTADATKYLNATGAWSTPAGGTGGGPVDLAANYPWTGQHSWAQPVVIGAAWDASKAVVSKVWVQTAGSSEFALNFTNNVDSAMAFMAQSPGTAANGNTAGKGRAYMLFYGDGVIAQQPLGLNPPFSSLDYYMQFYDVASPAKRSTVVYGYAADANSCFIVKLLAAPQTTFFAVNVNGDVTVSRDPTVALGVATKQYVDATAATGVNLSANYPWTGVHTWTKAGAFIADFNGGGLNITGGSSAISPAVNFLDEASAIQARIGFARTAGAFIASAGVNDLCVTAANANFRLDAAGSFVFTHAAAGAVIMPRLSVNMAIDTRARVSVTAYLPEWAFAFSNGVNASVNFAIDPPGTIVNGNGQGQARLIAYGDFVFGSYIDASTMYYTMRLRSHYDAVGLGTDVFGYAAYPGLFFNCYVDSTSVFSISTAGDVLLAHDPTAALHAVTKQYSDTKLAKAGGTMTGLLTLSGNPSVALDAAPKQYVDLRLLKAGDTMTGALTMTNASIIQNSAAAGALTIGVAEELLTLSTAGLTTDTTGNLLPAGSIILSVTCRITTTITTATNWAVGDATVADRFSTANATKTAGTTSVGLNQWIATRTTAGQGPDQAAAAKVRITCTGSNPGAGAIRITTRYITLAAATS